MKDKNYGWKICFACALLLFCTGGLGSTGFSAYQPYLISNHDLTNTQASAIVMVRNLFSLLGMLTTGYIISKFEIRRVVTAAMFVSASSFLVFGLSTTFAVDCAAAILAGSALGFGGMIPASILISRWFNTHRGLALGTCMAATGLSAIIASPLITFAVNQYSLRITFFMEAAFVYAAAVVVYKIVRSNPSCKNTEPIGASYVEAAKAFASKDASKGYMFLMMAGILLFGIPGNLLYSHISVLYSAEGFSGNDISLLLSVFGIALAAGKCTYGVIVDKIGTFKASWILYGMVLVGTSMCCLAGNGNSEVACIAVAMMGFGLAVTSVSISIYAGGIATKESYSKVVTCFQVLSTLGALLFGTVPGIIADCTGSYVIAFGIMAAISCFSAVLLQITYLLITKIDKKYSNASH